MKPAFYCTLLLLAAPLSASAAEPATAPTTQPYKGWVHIHHPGGNGGPAIVSHVNTLTGASWSETKTPGETMLLFWNPPTHEVADYHSSTGLIRTGSYSPSETRLHATLHQWTTYQDLVNEFRDTLGIGIDLQKITHRTEEGLNCYDFGDLAHTTKTDQTAEVLRGLPWIIWVDPQTHLIREALVDGRKLTLTYGGPDITSIYDLGAPRTAKIYDNRPTALTLAVLDRIEQRATIPFPDGVYVFLMQSGSSDSMGVAERSKNHWETRGYQLREGPVNANATDMPANWSTTGVDAFFELLTTLYSRDEWNGDGTTVHLHDPLSHPSEQTFTGEIAKSIQVRFNPAYLLYHTQVSAGRDGLGGHLDLISDPARPGLIGVQLQDHGLHPDYVAASYEYWIDPAHGDRPIQYVEQYFNAPPLDAKPEDFIAPTGRYKKVTNYSEYATLPAPDGRVYPTSWVETEYNPASDGTLVATTPVKYAFQFFPGRTLPPLKIAAPDAKLP